MKLNSKRIRLFFKDVRLLYDNIYCIYENNKIQFTKYI